MTPPPADDPAVDGKPIPDRRGALGVTVVVLAIYAAGAATFALLRGHDAGPSSSAAVVGASNSALSEAAEREVRTDTADQYKKEVQKSKEEWNAGLEQVERWKKEIEDLHAAASKKEEEWGKTVESRIEVFEEQGRTLASAMKDVAEMKLALDALAAEVKELKARPAYVAPTPGSGTGPAVPVPGTPAGPSGAGDGPTPEQLEAIRKKVEQALKDLSDPNAMKAFSATIVLGKYGGPAAVEPLLKVLKDQKDQKDYYPRMGSASALGQLKACDAVPALMDALLDKESSVFTTASSALLSITNLATANPTLYAELVVAADSSKQRRNEAKTKWIAWWRAHEGEVRDRLHQAGKTQDPPGDPGK